MLFIYSQSHGTALTESQNRPEKKPHAEPKDEDHAEKICDEDEHFVNVEKPSDKPSILVVMHHTFNSDHVVAGSRRLVTKPNVLLTVDCLFYEGHFLKCERNNAAWDEVKKKLEVYDNQKKVTLKASQTLFYIFLAGKTNGAHRDFVKKLEAVGHTETSSPEGCDYIVRFCPVASRVGTDVNAALNKIPVSWNMSDQLVGNKEPPVCVKNDAGNKNCAIRPSVGKDCSEAQNKMPVLGNKFAVILAGKTNKAHRDFVKKLEAVGQTEVSSPEGCDYVVCFCPVASRVGTDVSEALDRIPADKPSILVVMHHTFNHDHVVAESRRLVTKSNVHLTLDCLFNGRHFLDCKRNDAAWDEVKKKLGVYDNEELSLSWSLLNWIGFRLLLALVLEASCCKSTTDSRNRPEKKPHAEPNDEDPDVKRSKVEEHAQTSDKDEDFVNVEKPWRTFFVVSAGKTNGAHRDFVKKLEAVGQTEASSPEGCDYVVCFCPVASRVGTDVSEALDRIPADKPSILVVMHHTFNHDHVVAESRRLVTKSNVHLTLDCLFNGRHFLDCKRNDAAWDEVKKKLGVYDNEELSLSWSLLNWIGFRLLLALVLEASCCKSTTASKSATDQAPVLKSATDQDQASESVPHQDQASESVPHQDQASESVTHQDQASESVPHQDQASK
ncbi:uncharacterized protein LOC114849476 isoform X5 [Betta splendens]|uniref:Uncharacterized protein LOC114849476 isoform X5 n=1 Tax=Betta splendens TaxID=158456 RepID=A0A6P7LS50_BETSP|nr:uncharacterized protein LOC114849476 isoform X5 [Betta splendens]